jgi:hypothetical protein
VHRLQAHRVHRLIAPTTAPCPLSGTPLPQHSSTLLLATNTQLQACTRCGLGGVNPSQVCVSPSQVCVNPSQVCVKPSASTHLNVVHNTARLRDPRHQCVHVRCSGQLSPRHPLRRRTQPAVDGEGALPARETAGGRERDSERDTVGHRERDTVGHTVRDTVRKTVIGHSEKDSERDTAGETQWDTVRETVRETQWDTVRETARETQWDTVREKVRETQWDTVRETVRDTVGHRERDTVGHTVRDTVRKTVIETQRKAV